MASRPRTLQTGRGRGRSVLGAQGVDTRYRDIALQVGRERGATAAYIEVENANRLPATALAALRAADFVVDLSHSHDPEIRKLAPHGTRTLVVLEPPEILERMLPQVTDKDRVLHAQACIRQSRRMRVTTAAGTDFEVGLGELRGNCQYGFSDEPGHWDQWPGAFVTTYGNEGSANGTVVVAAGDIVFPQKEYVRTPITFRIEDGYIRAIEGGVDAMLLKATLDPTATRKCSPSPISAGVSAATRAGMRWDSTTRRTSRGRTGAAITATSCSRPGPTCPVAASAARRCISTFLSATHRSGSTIARWWRSVKSCHLSKEFEQCLGRDG